RRPHPRVSHPRRPRGADRGPRRGMGRIRLRARRGAGPGRPGRRVPARPPRPQSGGRRRSPQDAAPQRGEGGAGRGKEMTMRESELMARIEQGERIESAEEMTDEYRRSLVHLMTMQADSELAGGYGYVPWIAKAPGVEEKHVVAQIVKDELRH